MDQRKKTTAIQFVKYALVGVLNTLVTLGVIFLCKSIIGVNPLVSNAIGYVAGVINSFLWNKTWVFRSKNGYLREAVKFFIGFLVCYGVQFLTVWLLSYQSPLADFEIVLLGFVLSGYGIATLIGNVVYTVVNFVYNRAVTFK